ncbi:MAG: transglutaminase domain-containing protein [Planctomycetes bacterium]|nr:transglutaminase domain-containing protein [Planctomycetota bacterium]
MSIALWGYNSEYWFIALLAILAIEWAPHSPKKVAKDLAQMGMVSDICVILFILTSYWFMLDSPKAKNAIIENMIWLPVYFLPLILLLKYSTELKVDFRIFFFLTRKKAIKDSENHKYLIDPSWYYLYMCCLSAAMLNKQPLVYYICICLMSLYALWSTKSLRVNRAIWGGAILIVFLLGFFLSSFFRSAEQWVSDKTVQWLTQNTDYTNYLNTQETAIGKSGTISKGDHILLRIQSNNTSYLPGKIRLASYNMMLGNDKWITASKANILKKDKLESKWALDKLSSDITSPSKLEARNIHTEKWQIWFTPDSRNLIPLPEHAESIHYSKDTTFSSYPIGGVSADLLDPFTSMEITLGPNARIYEAPNENDTIDLNEHTAILEKIRKELELASQPPLPEVLNAVKKFLGGFQYSLIQGETPKGIDPMEYFLSQSKKGHCEYFATATVMLLRHFNIPTRYVTGYVVSEFSEVEELYIARAQDAHAWTEYWNGKNWVSFDTTPMGERQLSWTTPVKDYFSWVSFHFTLWRFSSGEDRMKEVIPIIIGLLLLYLIFRHFRGSKGKQSLLVKKVVDKKKNLVNTKTEALPFDEIEDYFHNLGRGRREAQTLKQWHQELSQKDKGEYDLKKLLPLINTEYRCLYDPKLMKETELKEHSENINFWLSERKA